MSTTAAPLWQPTDARIAAARLTDYRAWLARTRGDEYASYNALWRWSTSDLAGFWRSIFDYFEVIGTGSVNPVFTDLRMPGTTWFPAVGLNYVDQVFRHATRARPAIVAGNENGCIVEIGWAELERKVAALADTLRSRGVQRGDRVAGFLPNTPETVVAFLATASLGAVWSLCSPDMGVASVVDRFKQIGPKVLIAADGYRYGGRILDRRTVVASLIDALPTVQTHVRVPLASLPATSSPADSAATIDWAEATAGDKPLRAEQLPFNHPLWIVYSSGTTGLPKPIVHGHGGILLEHLKLTALHNDVGPMDRFHWYSSTGWIMWNCQVGGLLAGATICIYEGSPAWPDLGALWRFAGTARATFFGSGAAFYVNCMKAGITPRTAGQLDNVRTIGSTGSPLPADTHAWLQREFGADAWIAPISGGTDIASAFVGGNCTEPVYPGEMQCRCLGAKVEAWNDAGQSIVDQVGELVCTAPMPSMPLFFWNDPDGRRYVESYFDVFPGVWRHGDWIEITARGGAIIYGRSDSTINRSGIRMGTSELYSAVEALPEVADSLVVDLEYLGRPSYMPLFVVLAEGATLDDALRTRINTAIRDALTPKHVPNEIFAVPAVPRTLSGKKLEVPIKRLLLGEPIERIVNRDALANPESLDWYLRFAAARGSQSPSVS
jgi:acetoacetyl-CoA synthetase